MALFWGFRQAGAGQWYPDHSGLLPRRRKVQAQGFASPGRWRVFCEIHHFLGVPCRPFRETQHEAIALLQKHIKEFVKPELFVQVGVLSHALRDVDLICLSLHSEAKSCLLYIEVRTWGLSISLWHIPTQIFYVLVPILSRTKEKNHRYLLTDSKLLHGPVRSLTTHLDGHCSPKSQQIQNWARALPPTPNSPFTFPKWQLIAIRPPLSNIGTPESSLPPLLPPLHPHPPAVLNLGPRTARSPVTSTI